MFSKKQRHQIYKLALEKLENDTHPLIADNIKDAMGGYIRSTITTNFEI